jgi:hypothetical protein
MVKGSAKEQRRAREVIKFKNLVDLEWKCTLKKHGVYRKSINEQYQILHN